MAIWRLPSIAPYLGRPFVPLGPIAPVIATLSITLDNLSESSTGTILVLGGSSNTSLSDVILIAADTDVVGAISSLTLDNVSLSASGTLPVTSSSAIPLDNIVLSPATGVVLVSASSSVPSLALDSVVLIAADTDVVGAFVSLSLDSVICVAVWGAIVSPSLAITLDNVEISAAETTVRFATSNILIDPVSLLFTGSIPEFASLTKTLTNVHLASNVLVGFTTPPPVFVWTENPRGLSWKDIRPYRTIVWSESLDLPNSLPRSIRWHHTLEDRRSHTVPQTLIERPNESALYVYDFSSDPVIGATSPDPIASITSITATITNPTGESELPTFASPTISTDGKSVTVEITAPSDNNIDYLIRFTVVTVSGYVRVGLGVLSINED